MLFIKVMKNYLNATTVTLKKVRAIIYDAQSCAAYSLAVKTRPGTHCAVCFSPKNQGSSVQNASFVYVSFFYHARIQHWRLFSTSTLKTWSRFVTITTLRHFFCNLDLDNNAVFK